MRSLFLFTLFISTLLANPYQNLHTYTLKNGLKVLLLPDKKAQNVYIEVDVNVGMGAEDEENAGISHLVEHIVFRDQSVKDHDYYDLIKQRGATDVNGFTSYYQTQYITTINPQNGYWITETFAKMLFDKNVTQEDLEIERKALQIEIGEPNWTSWIAKLGIGKLVEKISDLFPSDANIFEDDFGIDPKLDKIEYKNASLYKENNKKFDLKAVMAHYHDYYYPSNMTLKIVGKFNLQKMKNTINNTFAKVPKREGKTLKIPLYKDAKLHNKPYQVFSPGGMDDTPQAELGAKLLAEDPKKMLILSSYMRHLADRLNREFRNKKGESYSVYGGVNQRRNAAIATISFTSPHEAFDKNIQIAKSWLEKEGRGDINDSTIHEALKQMDAYFKSAEHDVDSLLVTLDKYQHYKRYFGENTTKNSYELFQTITTEDFRKTLKETFVPEHAFSDIQRDYLLFPYEGLVLTWVLIFLFYFFLFYFFSAKINKRHIRLQRRLTSRFVALIIMVLAVSVSLFIYEWIVYLLSGKTSSDFMTQYDIPLQYLIMMIDFILSMLLFYVVVKKLFSWYFSKVLVTEKHLVLVGAKSRYIPLEHIAHCEIIPWSPKLWGKIHGVSILFWRPLLKIVSKNGEEIYLRSTNAKHLQEDLSKVITPVAVVEKKVF